MAAAIAGIASKLVRYGANFLIGGIGGVIQGGLDDDLAGVDATFNAQYANKYGMSKSLSSPFKPSPFTMSVVYRPPSIDDVLKKQGTPPLTKCSI